MRAPRSGLGIALVCCVIIAVLVGLACLTGCAPRPSNPPVYSFTTHGEAFANALKHAEDGELRVFTVLPTGSMKPLLDGGDMVLVDIAAPYSQLQVGEIITYRPAWAPTGVPYVHRLAAHDDYGWILTGDANAHYENRFRVTSDNYVGRVVAIYTSRK